MWCLILTSHLPVTLCQEAYFPLAGWCLFLLQLINQTLSLLTPSAATRLYSYLYIIIVLTFSFVHAQNIRQGLNPNMTLRREASIAMNMKEVCRHIEVLMSQTFNLILWWIKYFGQFLTHQVLMLPDFSSYHFLFRIWELDWSLTSRGCRILPSPALSTCQSLEWVCSTTTPSMRWETWGETTASTCSSRRPTPRTWSRRPRDKLQHTFCGPNPVTISINRCSSLQKMQLQRSSSYLWIISFTIF